jgi:hypothetical protein
VVGIRFSYLDAGVRKPLLVIGRTPAKVWGQAFKEVQAAGADDATLRVEFRVMRKPDGSLNTSR